MLLKAIEQSSIGLNTVLDIMKVDDITTIDYILDLMGI